MEKYVEAMPEAGKRFYQDFHGKCKKFLIGPEAEKWDVIVFVEYLSVEKFMEFAQGKAYLKNAGHRTAALEDSRLLPTTEINE